MHRLIQLVETILKNVPGALLIWGKRDFQEVVVASVCNTKFLRAREALLELVQSLGITYASDKNVCFAQAYTELLTRHRISFPPPNKQNFVAPTERVVTGAGKSPRAPGQRLQKSARKDHSLVDIYDPTGIFSDEGVNGEYETVRSTPRRRDKPRHPKEASIEDQLDAVSSSISLLNDIIDNLGVGEKVADNELINEIVPSIQKTAETVIRIIQNDSDNSEELMARLFSANDAITEALERYEAAKKGKKLPSKFPASKAAQPPSAPPKPHTKPVADDDEFDEFTALATRNRSSMSLNAPSSGTARPVVLDLLGFGAEPVAMQPVLQPPPATSPTNTNNSRPNLFAPASAASPPAAASAFTPGTVDPFDMLGAISPSNSSASLNSQPSTGSAAVPFDLFASLTLTPTTASPANNQPAPFAWPAPAATNHNNASNNTNGNNNASAFLPSTFSNPNFTHSHSDSLI